MKTNKERARIEKWNGDVPMVSGGGSGAGATVVPVTVPMSK